MDNPGFTPENGRTTAQTVQCVEEANKGTITWASGYLLRSPMLHSPKSGKASRQRPNNLAVTPHPVLYRALPVIGLHY